MWKRERRERERDWGIYSLCISQLVILLKTTAPGRQELSPAVGLAVEEKVRAEEGKNGFQNGAYLRAILWPGGRW